MRAILFGRVVVLSFRLLTRLVSVERSLFARNVFSHIKEVDSGTPTGISLRNISRDVGEGRLELLNLSVSAQIRVELINGGCGVPTTLLRRVTWM